ncbi:hypothetical protein C0J52_06535 [Blattella germanica]|nr:hypothetical protein C0J52_06535 [Blattella germanica]
MKTTNCLHFILMWLLACIDASTLGTSGLKRTSETMNSDNLSTLVLTEVTHDFHSATTEETSLYHECTAEAIDCDTQSTLEVKHDNEVNTSSWKCVLSNTHNETTTKKVLYNTHKVYTLWPKTDEQIQALLQLEKNYTKELDFWTLVRLDGPVEIMATPKTFPILENFTKHHNLTATVRINDVQILIDAQLPPANSTIHSFNWDYFYDLDKIYTWMDSLEANYSDVLTPLLIGCSYEGRPIRGVKLSKKRNNPGVFIEAGTHAREWIATTTALWIIYALLTSDDEDIKKVSEDFDWYIFPTVNPDGYHYSYVTDRFWRKTRSSGDPCSLIYPGPKPFSEVETLRLSEYVREIRDNVQVYLDFHSYSQILMFPYSYTTNHTDDYDIYMFIANKSAAALKLVNGTDYVVGDIANIADGSSVDWMYGVLKIPLCFAYELRDKGQKGMLLPPNEIIPTAKETLVSIQAILEYGGDIIRNDYKKWNSWEESSA